MQKYKNIVKVFQTMQSVKFFEKGIPKYAKVCKSRLGKQKNIRVEKVFFKYTKKMAESVKNNAKLFNRPGVAGAVLQTPS